MDVIRKYADNGDRENLRYVFSGAFDADPTFAQYEADYQYCKSKGLLDPYRELTPLTEDRSRWDRNYWYQIQQDLKENLSDRRLEHMKAVARVVFADKVSRLETEREARSRREARPASSPSQTPAAGDAEIRKKQEDLERQTARDNEERERKRAASQRAYEESQKANEERMRAARQQVNESEQRANRSERPRRSVADRGADGPKKALGAAVAAVLIILILYMIWHARKVNQEREAVKAAGMVLHWIFHR